MHQQVVRRVQEQVVRQQVVRRVQEQRRHEVAVRPHHQPRRVAEELPLVVAEEELVVVRAGMVEVLYASVPLCRLPARTCTQLAAQRRRALAERLSTAEPQLLHALWPAISLMMSS